MRASTPEDGPAIVALMREAGLQPHVAPAYLHWKYWQPRPDWSGSRSYVLTDGEMLLAHGAVVPGTMRSGDREFRVIHMIDWAARRNAVGAGVVLMKHIGTLTDFLLGIGGSADTLRIMPRMGYGLRGSVTGYARTLSPLRILDRPARPRWKRVPRMARSLLWSLSAPRSNPGGWEIRRVGEEDLAQIVELLSRRTSGLAFLGRTAAILRHTLACPIVPVELYSLEKAGTMAGYFLLSFAPGQARLIDLWMNSDDLADWRALVHSVVRTAQRRGGLAELVAWSSDLRLSQVFKTCGFHARLSLPIYLRCSGDLPMPQEPLSVQMIDNDAFYLYFGGNELWA